LGTLAPVGAFLLKSDLQKNLAVAK